MSTIVLRYCDRCKNEIPEKDKIWIVQVVFTDETTFYSSGAALNLYMKTLATRKEWCRSCMDSMNLLGYAWKAPAATPNIPPPTFEDQLRAIIQDEIIANEASR